MALFGIEVLLSRSEPVVPAVAPSSAEEFRRRGFSLAFLRNFFHPFSAGIFLDEDLGTDARLLKYLLRLFTLGRAALPEGGTGKLAEALAQGLPSASMRLNTAVTAIERNSVQLASGETLRVDAGMADRLMGRPARPFHGTHCAYFRPCPAFRRAPWLANCAWQKGSVQCGDQTGYPSLNSALESGRRVGEML